MDIVNRPCGGRRFWLGLVPFAVLGGFASVSMSCDTETSGKTKDDVSWAKLPAAVREGMQKVLVEHLVAGETVKLNAVEAKGGGVYEAEAVFNGKSVDFYVNTDGKCLGNEGPEDEEQEKVHEGGGLKAGDAWLGVGIQLIQPQNSKEGSDGGLVTAVYPGGPAAKAGLSNGDVIKQVEGTPIRVGSELGLAVRQRKPGDKVKLLIQRSDKRMELVVTLGKFTPTAHAEAGEEDEEGEGGEGGEGGER